MNVRAALAALVLGVVALVAPAAARADGPAPATATFALVIGSNRSVDANLAPLRYADDDAARYLDLFRLLGARTYLLTRLDENTRRLHPQAAAEAIDPRKASLDAAVAGLAADVARAAERNVETLVYFVYAGHGDVKDGEGYITLEDARLTGGDLARIFARIPATRIHLIADACASYFLAYSRGPGGERRPIGAFGAGTALAADGRVGFLLSTSSARESHEWEAFQSGVFSHEVRSGLYGAADADGDGQVSYREIAAFVARANARIPNERFRPDLHARAPRGEGTLLDLRRVGRRLEIDGKHAGHYYLEDARGVRLADVHNAAGASVSLVRPPPSGRAYLRQVDDDTERVIDPAPAVVSVADLAPEPPRVASRGAAHEAFGTIFSVPFDRGAVEAYPDPVAPPDAAPAPPRTSLRRPIAIGTLAVGGAAVLAGGAFTVAAALRHDDAPGQSQAELAAMNDAVADRQTAATALYVGGGVAIATGLFLLLWPGKTGF